MNTTPDELQQELAQARAEFPGSEVGIVYSPTGEPGVVVAREPIVVCRQHQWVPIKTTSWSADYGKRTMTDVNTLLCPNCDKTYEVKL